VQIPAHRHRDHLGWETETSEARPQRWHSGRATMHQPSLLARSEPSMQLCHRHSQGPLPRSPYVTTTCCQRHCQLGRGWVCGGACQCPVVIRSVVLSGCCGQADDLVPGGEPGGHFAAVGIGAKPVAAGSKVRGDAAERREEPLRVPG
jgi:hypothetical protein